MEDSKSSEDYPDQARKTTLTSLRKTTKMKKSGRGPGNNSPVAKKVVSKNCNNKNECETFSNFTLPRPEIVAKFTVTMDYRLQLILLPARLTNRKREVGLRMDLGDRPANQIIGMSR